MAVMLGFPGGYRIKIIAPNGDWLWDYIDLRQFARLINREYSEFETTLLEQLEMAIRGHQGSLGGGMLGLPGGYRLILRSPDDEQLINADLSQFAEMINLQHSRLTKKLLEALQNAIREDTDAFAASK